MLVGLSGQLSLGHGALMATGAYACALMSAELGDRGTTGPLLLVLPLVTSVVAAGVVGGIIGLAGARLHGPYLAGLTLTLTIVVPAITTTFAGQPAATKVSRCWSSPHQSASVSRSRSSAGRRGSPAGARSSPCSCWATW
ncbi:hypothetical protein [Aeromicrobium sp. UC242_57]|uniref:ABC transporter permease subunit n=1 Tax=Aeromicrobium sp. UC242_57 TaxID=3374624 RepID=UPI0037B51B54